MIRGIVADLGGPPPVHERIGLVRGLLTGKSRRVDRAARLP
jgi:hypothetical protein